MLWIRANQGHTVQGRDDESLLERLDQRGQRAGLAAAADVTRTKKRFFYIILIRVEITQPIVILLPRGSQGRFFNFKYFI